jgi:hypothetical protein
MAAGLALPRPALGSDVIDEGDVLEGAFVRGTAAPSSDLGSVEAAGPWGLGPWGSFEPRAERGGLWLGVRAGATNTADERHRVFGLVEFGVGLDGWIGDRTPALAAASDAEDPDEAELDGGLGGTAPLGPARPPIRRDFGEDTRRGATAPGARPAIAPRPAPSDDGPLAPESARLARLARAAVSEALRAAGGDAELRRLDGMAARSRAAASLPELRLAAGTSRDESLRLAPTAADPARFTRDGGHDRWIEARLIWRLDSAIFARDEIAIARLRAQRREELARLTTEVLEALVSWQRARLVLASAVALPDERDAAIVRQFGAVARLDALTEGWFSEQIEREQGRE